ncbi:MAG: hypothetical protein JST06_03620 [Bacteroidetes bacterium]|nr:hypothetical protein [Bacteroidota bacterium]MBS1630830.1 hypothetical protein [Bacteroidota bacterium]
MQFITIWDYVLLPIYLLLIWLVGKAVRNKYYPEGHAWRPYFMPGLWLKVSGALFIGLIYQYYYGYGDTVGYFEQAKIINSAFVDSPVRWFKLAFHLAKPYDSEYIDYISRLMWYDSPANYIVSTVTAIIGVFTFTKYLCISAVMGAMTFTGQWAMFRAFAKQYPTLIRYVAISCLFIPSVAIWGSGIFKDTICMFGLGWITYGTFQLLINRKISLGSLAMLTLSIYLIGITKVYILIAFLPSVALWVFLQYSHRIRYRILRWMFLPVILAVVSSGFMYITTENADLLGAYSIDQFASRSEITREYIYDSGDDESSSYSLGEVDPTIQGMLRKFPLAVNATLFRPYLWEAKKAIVFFNALESFIFLLLALKLLFQVGPINIWRAIVGDPNIQFLLVFTLIFAFAVGISTYNFGSLSRYRIPCLPFFALAMGLIYFKKFSPSKRRFLPFSQPAPST